MTTTDVTVVGFPTLLVVVKSWVKVMNDVTVSVP